jgi:Zn-dependent M28 family amino/carboxypeptidase
MNAAADALEELGLAVRRQRVAFRGHTTSNLVADAPGHGPAPRALVLVTAHLDSVNWEGGASAAAPGADDNASGCAGVLEMARILAPAPRRHDLRFVLFGGEEQGLFGSKHHVGRLPARERARIRAVLNMDMIASTNTGERSVLLEGAQLSATLLDGLAAEAATWTKLAVERSLRAANSDHVPFIDAGIPAVLTIEGADHTNDRVHSARDALSEIDVALAAEIVRMNVAFVARSAEI